MANLKTMLLKEQNRLRQILEKTEDRLQEAPQGTLRLSKCGKSVQYYHCMPGGRKNGTYLPRTECEFARRLAQKAYDEKIKKLAGKRLAQIMQITKDYSVDEIENVYTGEKNERRTLITPVEKIWDEKLNDWIAEDYNRKEFHEGVPVILTEKGERVRSKSEKILADFFYRNGIPYKYEKPLYLKGFGTVHPDFTFLSKETGGEIYWEHDGKMDDPAYARNAVRKIRAYEENDIYPGERLILTFETEKSVLDIRLVQRLAEKYLF